LATNVPNCEALAAEIGVATGLPEGLLPAISRIEAGRGKGKNRQAWPWTLNHGGKGLYFETEAEALTYAQKATSKGPANLDFGCMQINHRWHRENFTSIKLMMDPRTNIRYAAQFLSKLYDRHGSWAAAVRNYHSSDEVRGKGYENAFVTAHRQMQRQGPNDDPQLASLKAGPMFTGPEGLRKGGLFGMPLQGTDNPLVQILTQTVSLNGNFSKPSNKNINALYDALLALNDQRRRASGEKNISNSANTLTELTAAPPELARQWDKVEAFRLALSKP
jgi:hypothetical protein